MIPKTIHYCWFGRGEKPELLQKCIESWHKFCPDYKIIEWNEDNFDVNSVKFSHDAYEAKKFAFVSDYARLKIIYETGGIYLDTDVMLFNSLDDLLQYKCFLASDDVRYVNTGLGFGSEKGNTTIKTLLDAYSSYEYPAGTCVSRDTQVLEKILPNWEKSDRSKLFGDVYIIGMHGYSKYARHFYSYTWSNDKNNLDIDNTNQFRTLTKKEKIKWSIAKFVRKPLYINYFDKRKGSFAEKAYTFCAYDLIDYGPIYFIKKAFSKITTKK